MARLLIEVQFHDDNGDPLAGGKLYFYESGTTTFKTTYVDEAHTTENTNPIILDAFGRCTDGIWFDDKAKLQIRDANDVIVPNGTFDPVYTTSGGGSGSGEVGLDDDPWTWYLASHTYSLYDLVVDPTTRYWYQSTANGNLNNALTDETWWVRIGPIYQWNTERTFRTNNYAYYDGLLYRSKTDSNQNNDPQCSKANWEPLGLQYRHQEIGSIGAGGSQALDLCLYNSFSATLNGNATFTFSNEPEATEMYTFDMVLTMNGLTGSEKPTFPASVKWTRGYVPPWTGTGIDVITFVKYPNDANYYAQEYSIDAL